MQEYLKKLGFKAKDRVTGFEGVISSISFDLYGCVMVTMSPAAPKEGGKLEYGQWFDEKRIEITGDKPVMEPPKSWSKEAVIGPAEKPAFDRP